MICRQCLQRATRQQVSRTTRHMPRASFSHTSRLASTPVSTQTATATNPRPNNRPAATSYPDVAQPFSTALSPAPTSLEGDAGAAQIPAKNRKPSSVPEGTVLKGLNFMKNQQDPVAKADDQYPDWLWTLLETKKKDDTLTGALEDNLFAKSKKQRQRANKELRKLQSANADNNVVKIPLYEQTVDLPAATPSDTGSIALASQARHDLTKSMREKRRSAIKEANFLKQMG